MMTKCDAETCTIYPSQKVIEGFLVQHALFDLSLNLHKKKCNGREERILHNQLAALDVL